MTISEIMLEPLNRRYMGCTVRNISRKPFVVGNVSIQQTEDGAFIRLSSAAKATRPCPQSAWDEFLDVYLNEDFPDVIRIHIIE